MVATVFATLTVVASAEVHAQCFNPTQTPSVPVTSVATTSDALCNIASSNACNGGVCTPDYYTVQWETWRCWGGFMNGATWTDGDHGYAALCIGLGGVPLPEQHSCTAYNTATCSSILCDGAGQCPTQEFCAGDGICRQTVFCNSTAQCGEYVCIGGLCAPTPDLVVSSLTVSPASPQRGAVFTVTATITNQGSAGAVASTMDLRIGGESTPPRFSVQALAPGASQVVTRSATLSAAGSFRTTARVDIFDNVEEAGGGELNNVTWTSFTVTQ